MKKMESCNHVKEVNEAEIGVIERHIAEHKWCNNICDSDEGIIDFIQKYAWIMHEMYCESACPDRDNCAVRNKHKDKQNGKLVQNGEKEKEEEK